MHSINVLTTHKKKTIFKKHQASECHRQATEALVVLPKHIQGDVSELLSQQLQEEKATNRTMLIEIFENIRFLAHQGLPLRGSDENADSNFIQLLHLHGVICP